MKNLRFQPSRWIVVLTSVSQMLLGAFFLLAQTRVDMTGYWAFRLKDGGVNYFQFQQTGNTVSTVTNAGRGGGRGGRGHSGTLQNGQLHLGPRPAPPTPAPALGQARETLLFN